MTPAPALAKTFPLEPIEKASTDELRALQLKRLQATLHLAYANSAAYRAKFDAAGVHPSECHSLADLAKFPFTTKADLRDNYPFGMLAVPREQCVRIHASSGTTGKPTVVAYTHNDIDVWSQVVCQKYDSSFLPLHKVSLRLIRPGVRDLKCSIPGGRVCC